MNTITNFAHTSSIIAAAVAKLMDTPVRDPKQFRLSVATPDDVAEEGTGQYRVEAPVVLALLDTAYAEIVSAATRTTRKDAQIALHDRHRHASGWDDQYDGSDDKEVTADDLKNALVETVERAEVVLRYAKHIAAVKAGGAEWLAGFEVNKWVPTPDLDPTLLDEVMQACITETGLATHIKLGRVTKVRSIVENRLMPFNDWCDQQMNRKGVSDQWKNKLAEARTCDIHLHDIPVNTACEYIGDLVLGHAFNRDTTRLQDAIIKVANNNYMRISYAIQNNVAATTVNKREIDNAFKKTWDFIPYSSMLQADIKEVKASEEWADHQLKLDIESNKRAAQESLRQAMREQVMFDIEKQAIEVQATMSQANELRALLAKQRAELYTPKPTEVDEAAEQLKQAKRKAAAEKAAATRKAKAEAKAQAAQLIGIVGTSTMPKLNPKGVRG
jgi:hypothetical protein